MTIICFDGVLINLIADALLLLNKVADFLDTESIKFFLPAAYCELDFLDIELIVLCIFGLFCGFVFIVQQR